MTSGLAQSGVTRRDVLRGGAAIVIACHVPAVASAGMPPPARALDPARLDSWLAIGADGNVTAFWGKMDMGQGVDTGIAQIIAEELDVRVADVNVVFGDTAMCIDQGGASGSTGLERSGAVFRAAAAEARRVLLERASAKFYLPVARLTIRDGVISAPDAGSVSYRELVVDRPFESVVDWNGEYGNDLTLGCRATPKSPGEYRIVGTSVPRKDIRDKLLARTEYLHDLRIPGMLHGRVIRPPRPGARLLGVERESVASLAGVRVVVDGDFVGVVAPDEWRAIKATRMLEVRWDESDSGFPTNSENLHDWIRHTDARETGIEEEEGDVERAIVDAGKKLFAEYEWPFQSHARMGPAAAIADVRDSEATIWTDSQKPYDTARGAARLLEMPRPSQPEGRGPYEVRAVWMPGPGSYGRSDAGDGAMDAVILSQSVAAPVRVQWMRHDGHGWDPKGPASVVTCRAGFDASGTLTGYHFHIKGFSRHDQNSREDAPGEVLAGHLVGHASTPSWRLNSPEDSYRVANKRYSWAAVAPLRQQASPLRTSHFRDPYGPEVHFASESFVDEMAYATAVDPLAFRLGLVSDERDRAVLQAAAELADWQPRTVPRRQRDASGNLTGTGISYAKRGGSVNAVVAEVIVTPASGRVRVRRIWVGADHGLIVNPFTLERTIEGNLLQAVSRTLFEEVLFDEDGVKSIDWNSYPVLLARDAPDEVRIRHINRPELGPRGAGEPTTRVMPAAIANAVFDATGKRLRRVPFTPARVRAALSAA